MISSCHSPPAPVVQARAVAVGPAGVAAVEDQRLEDAEHGDRASEGAMRPGTHRMVLNGFFVFFFSASFLGYTKSSLFMSLCAQLVDSLQLAAGSTFIGHLMGLSAPSTGISLPSLPAQARFAAINGARVAPSTSKARRDSPSKTRFARQRCL